MVDSAEHEVRSLGHQRFDSEHNAIGRRSIDLPPALVPLDWPHRVMESERMARRALLPIGRDHSDFSQWLRGSNKALESVRKNPVVVRAEKPHLLLHRRRSDVARYVFLEDAAPVSPQNSDHAHCVMEFTEIAPRAVDRGDRNVRYRESRVRGANDEIGFVLVSVPDRLYLVEHLAANGAKAGLAVV